MSLFSRPPLPPDLPPAYRWKRVVAVFVSTILLVGSVYFGGSYEVFGRLRALDPVWILVGVMLSGPQLVLAALRWRFTSERIGISLPFGSAVTEYYRAFLLNQVLPLGIVGDLLRVRRQATRGLGEKPIGTPRAAFAVIVERVSGQVVLFVWLLLSAPLWGGVLSVGEQLPVDFSWQALLGAAVFVLAVLFFLGRHWALRWIPREAREGAWRATFSVKALCTHSFLSSAVLLTLVLQYWAITEALGLGLGPKELLLFALPMLAVSSLPLTASGWGAREATGGIVFGAAQLSAGDGVAVGVAFGATQLLSAVPAVLLFVFPTRRSQKELRPNVKGAESQEASSPSLAEVKGARFSVWHSVGVLSALAVGLWSERAWGVAIFGAASLVAYLTLGERGGATGSRFGPPNLVTLLRLFLVVYLGVSGIPSPFAALLVLAILCLDGVDGWLARRLGTSSEHGARFDMETDALLVLVAGVTIYRGEVLDAWILLPGLMRYIYVLAMATGAFREAPPSRIGRAVFTVVACSLILSLWPLNPIQAPFAVFACALLSYSFARSIRWSVS